MNASLSPLAALPTAPTSQAGPAPWPVGVPATPPPGVPAAPTVSSALNELTDTLSAMDSELSELESRLTNVLRPGSEVQNGPSDATKMDSKVARSPIVERINELRSVASVIRSRIRSVTKRLEV